MATAPVFFVDRVELAGHDRILLDGAEGRHAATVRRIQVGERVDVSDGAGLVGSCVVRAVGRDRLELDVLDVRQVAAAQPRLVVVQALPKLDRGELAVELMTEAGVDELVPWSAARCITQWRGERGVKALGKWRAQASAAAKQSRRAWLPQVRELARTKAVAQLLKSATAAFVLHEGASAALSEQPLPGSGDIVLVIGPEGGITPEEIASFEAAGADRVRLGPSVLRTSTAGVVAASVLLSRTDRWSAAGT